MTGLHGTSHVAVRIRIILPYLDLFSGPADQDPRPHPTFRHKFGIFATLYLIVVQSDNT